MTPILKICATAALVCAIANAATSNASLSINASSVIGTTFTFSGNAVLSGFGSGLFNSAPASSADGMTLPVEFTITISGSALTGELDIPLEYLTMSSTGVQATVTINSATGTGAFAGATGSFTLSGFTKVANGTTSNSVSISFSGTGTITTTGTTASGPAISAVEDAAGYTANIAEGSLFVVKGSGLSASGTVETSFPLPTVQNGVSINFTPTSGGPATSAYIVYLYNQNGVNQIAAVLPSTLATGNYTVTITNAGATSAPFPVTVVESKVALITQDATGSGLALIQNYISPTEEDIDRYTTAKINGVPISPAWPGQTLTAWGTGMGPVTGGDNVASPGVNFLTNGSGDNVRIIAGGESITPVYAGRAPGLAGADQFNFVLPADVATGCTVPFQISLNGQLSNLAYISIAPDDTTPACAFPGLTSTQLQGLDLGQSLTLGSFSLSQISGAAPVANIAGGFQQFSSFEIAAANTQLASVASGSCSVATVSSQAPAPPGGTALDAGTLTLTGPTGSSTVNGLTLNENQNSYSANIPGPANEEFIAGAYTLTGAGGKSAGPFSQSITLGSPAFAISGSLPGTIVRSQGLNLSWNGGNATDEVIIQGTTATITASGASQVTSGSVFICVSTAGTGGFTVPPNILGQMQAISAAQISAGTGISSLSVTSGPVTAFGVPLISGASVSMAQFVGAIGLSNAPVYQ